ncbi:MAG: DUF4238 domain-containing protein [Candidatus Firestonebacteria bacterium]
MRCHYVPQFYLRNFAIHSKPKHVYAYRRKYDPFETKISTVAAKNDLYIFKDKNTGKKNDEIEKMFAWIESSSAPIINRIISQDSFSISSLSNQEQIVLANFIAFLHTRNLSFREQQKNLYSAGIKINLKIKAEDEKVFKQDIKDAQIKIESDKEIEDLRQSILDFDKHFKIGYDKSSNDFFLKQSLLLSLKLSPIIFNKEWHLLESDSGRVFITSDNPVSLIRPENLPPFYGVGFINGHIAVPLSPYKCLLLKNGKDGAEKLKIDRNTVNFFNRHVMFFAHKFVYSSLLSKDTQDDFNKTKEGASEQVIIN